MQEMVLQRSKSSNNTGIKGKTSENPHSGSTRSGLCHFNACIVVNFLPISVERTWMYMQIIPYCHSMIPEVTPQRSWSADVHSSMDTRPAFLIV